MSDVTFPHRGSRHGRPAGTTTIVLALSLVLSVACGASGMPTSAQDRETVSGRFAIVYGDPPPDSGQPASMRYTLTDKQGQQWTLTFDASVYTPPGGITSFNGKDVEVQGRRTGGNRLLVESMRLL